jgi:hypothetical protein
MSWSWDRRCEHIKYGPDNVAGRVLEDFVVELKVPGARDAIEEAGIIGMYPRYNSQSYQKGQDLLALLSIFWPWIQCGFSREHRAWFSQALDSLALPIEIGVKLCRLRQESIWGRAECNEILWEALNFFVKADSFEEDKDAGHRFINMEVDAAIERIGGLERHGPGIDQNTFEDWLWRQDRMPRNPCFSPLRVPRMEVFDFYIGTDGWPLRPPMCYNPRQMPMGNDYLEYGLFYILSDGECRQDIYRPRPVPQPNPRIFEDPSAATSATSQAISEHGKKKMRTSGKSGSSSKPKSDGDEVPQGQPQTSTSSTAAASSGTSGLGRLPIVYPFYPPLGRVHTSADSASTEPREDDE